VVIGKRGARQREGRLCVFLSDALGDMWEACAGRRLEELGKATHEWFRNGTRLSHCGFAHRAKCVPACASLSAPMCALELFCSLLKASRDTRQLPSDYCLAALIAGSTRPVCSQALNNLFVDHGLATTLLFRCGNRCPRAPR
jgi:hypothetical protein